MSEVAKLIIRDWLARIDAGVIEPEDLGLTLADVEAVAIEVG